MRILYVCWVGCNGHMRTIGTVLGVSQEAYLLMATAYPSRLYIGLLNAG